MGTNEAIKFIPICSEEEIRSKYEEKAKKENKQNDWVEKMTRIEICKRQLQNFLYLKREWKIWKLVEEAMTSDEFDSIEKMLDDLFEKSELSKKFWENNKRVWNELKDTMTKLYLL